MADDHVRKPANKRRVSVTLDSAFVDEAKAYGLNISETAERALEERVKAERMKRFSETNREAARSWDRLIDREGLWSDGLRQF